MDKKLTQENIHDLCTAIIALDAAYSVIEDVKMTIPEASDVYKPISNAMYSINRSIMLLRYQCVKHDTSLSEDMRNYFM